MGETLSPNEISSEGANPSLVELLKLPIETRCRHVTWWGWNDLNAAIRTLRDDGLALPEAFDVERLAWAVAFNIEGVPWRSKRVRYHDYKDFWSSDAKWSLVWSDLTRPSREEDPAGWILLAELASSVACEQRDDWQPPSARPIEFAEADRAFESVHARNRQNVLGYIYSKFGSRAGEPEKIAADAWARVFLGYWQPNARLRFLGVSSVSTLVCGTARFVALTAIGEKRVIIQMDEKVGSSTTAAGSSPSVSNDPLSNMEAQELKDHVRECLKLLPAKRRIVATMVLIEDMRPTDVAALLKVSKSAITQHITAAKLTLQDCLQKRGAFRQALTDSARFRAT